MAAALSGAMMLRRASGCVARGAAPWGVRQGRSLWVQSRAQVQHSQRPRLATPLSRTQTAHRGFATDDKGKDAEAPSALAVQNALTVQEKTEWQKKWDDFKGAAFQSRIFEHYKEGAERIDDFIEDSDNIFVRGIRSMKHAMFSETEEGETLALIKKLDPTWDLHAMLMMLEEEVLQKWVESFLRGDEEGVEFIAKWCTDRALQMCIVHFKERERIAPGARMDDRVLFIEEVTYESAVIVDNQPCLLFNFEVQSVGAFYNAEGECVAVRCAALPDNPRVEHGDPDNIEKTYYTWGMQLDTVEWEDEEGATHEKLEWKLAEFVTRGKVPLPI